MSTFELIHNKTPYSRLNFIQLTNCLSTLFNSSISLLSLVESSGASVSMLFSHEGPENDVSADTDTQLPSVRFSTDLLFLGDEFEGGSQPKGFTLFRNRILSPESLLDF